MQVNFFEKKFRFEFFFQFLWTFHFKYENIFSNLWTFIHDFFSKLHFFSYLLWTCFQIHEFFHFCEPFLNYELFYVLNIFHIPELFLNLWNLVFQILWIYFKLVELLSQYFSQNFFLSWKSQRSTLLGERLQAHKLTIQKKKKLSWAGPYTPVTRPNGCASICTVAGAWSAE